VGFFWDRSNTHQCSYVTRADRRLEGLVAEGWVGGMMGGGMGGLQKLITDLDMKIGYKGGA
jgi:hypothetical protein